MEPSSTMTPPSSAPLPIPPESAAPAPVESTKVGKADLFARKKPRVRWVTMPDGTQTLIGAVKPGEMAWVSNQCFVKKPDPDEPEKEIIDWDGTRRGFYMVAIALREPDGSRSFAGSIDDPAQWIYGAQKVMDLENEEYEPLFAATNELSGFAKGAKEAAGKGSGKTPGTG